MDFVAAMKPVLVASRIFGLMYYEPNFKILTVSRFCLFYCIIYRLFHALIFFYSTKLLYDEYFEEESSTLYRISFVCEELMFLLLSTVGSLLVVANNSVVFKFLNKNESYIRTFNGDVKYVYNLNRKTLFHIYGCLQLFEIINVYHLITRMKTKSYYSSVLIFEFVGYLVTDYGYMTVLLITVSLFNLLRSNYKIINEHLVKIKISY